jgi:hypothetical protein
MNRWQSRVTTYIGAFWAVVVFELWSEFWFYAFLFQVLFSASFSSPLPHPLWRLRIDIDLRMISAYMKLASTMNTHLFKPNQTSSLHRSSKYTCTPSLK